MSISRQAKNRRDTMLDEDTYEVENGDGEIKSYSFENLMVASASDISGFKEMKIGEPTSQQSLLSDEPGYLFRLEDIEVVLSKREFQRLALSALTPREVNLLREQFGFFSLIDETEYDLESGAALQPKFRVPQE